MLTKKKKRLPKRTRRNIKTIRRKWKKTRILLRKRRWLVLAVTGGVLIGGFVLFFKPQNLGPLLNPPPENALYRQSDLPVEARVQDLLSRMTLEEKIGQMMLVDKDSLGKTEDISRYYLGGVLSGGGAKPDINTPQDWLDMINSMKSQAKNSRLKIPILYGIDANHGHSNVLGATVFPHSIGLGASQDSKLVEDIAQVTAEELAATGVNWSFSPSLDAPKDIRWGRVYESFSDDPVLNSELGASYVKGTQATSNISTSGTRVLATAKHFLGAGSMEWGQSSHKTFKIDQGATTSNMQTLDQEFLPPYIAAIQAGVSSIMIGLNQWNDQRIIDSKFLVTDKLKKELGFKGFVVSDWFGVYEYAGLSKYEANISAINAGLDMAMLPFDYKSFLSDVRTAVERGKISRTRIDDAVSRILRKKFETGLFDEKTGTVDVKIVGSDKNRQLARRAVASSAVLLKNSNSLLPLPKDNVHILVAGSGADNVGRQSGGWTIEWQGVDGNWMPGVTSILEGIRLVAGDTANIEYDKYGQFDSLTKKADVGVVVISEEPYAEGWGDNANPVINEPDLEAIERLKETSKKVVVIMLSGRPLLIADHLPLWDAAIAAWLPGSEGAGIADVLFGDNPFLARLPLTWPASIQQVPTRADGSTKDGTRPLFERGFGL